jgi:uncharacterized protein YjiS (DUF1127 family)
MKSQQLDLGDFHASPQPLRAVTRLMDAVGVWRKRARQRYELAHLDPLIRRDIGLSDAELWLEASKLPWVP